jgi:hypothetical protein
MTNPVLDDNLRRLLQRSSPRLSEEDLDRAFARFEGRRQPVPRHGRVLASIAAALLLGLLGWLALHAPLRPATPGAQEPGKKESPELVARWIADLGSASPEVREKAKERLLAMGPSALAPLEQALYHEDPEVRVQSQVVARVVRRRAEIQGSLAFVRAAVRIVRAHWSARDFTDISAVVRDAFDPEVPTLVHYVPRKSVGDAFDMARKPLEIQGVHDLVATHDADALTPAQVAALDKDDGILFLGDKAAIRDLSGICLFTLPDKAGWSAYVVVGVPELANPNDPFVLAIACAQGDLADFFDAVRLTPQPGGGVKLSEVDPDFSRLGKTLKKGDVVRALDGTPTNAAPELLRLADRPGGSHPMTVDRDGKVFTLEFKILERAYILKTGPKAEEEAKKLFEEAENLLSSNRRRALEIYQQLAATYSKTEFVSTAKKASIEERIAEIKAKRAAGR